MKDTKSHKLNAFKNKKQEEAIEVKELPEDIYIKEEPLVIKESDCDMNKVQEYEFRDNFSDDESGSDSFNECRDPTDSSEFLSVSESSNQNDTNAKRKSRQDKDLELTLKHEYGEIPEELSNY